VRVVDGVAIVALVAIIVVLALIIARQRHMLRSAGAIHSGAPRQPMLYGVARYDGEEFRWYRAIDLGPRATRVLHRGQLQVISRREPPERVASLPPTRSSSNAGIRTATSPWLWRRRLHRIPCPGSSPLLPGLRFRLSPRRPSSLVVR